MKVGIIVGRFQSHRLTDGHKELIRQVISKCDRLIIFVGVYPLKPNFKNPLPFDVRRWMLFEFLPQHVIVSHQVKVLPIVDLFNIPLWSSELDNQINSLTTKTDKVTLYGSRDSFINNYVGKYTTKEIAASGDSSATKLREEIKMMYVDGATSEEFRKGVIWALRYEI